MICLSPTLAALRLRLDNTMTSLLHIYKDLNLGPETTTADTLNPRAISLTTEGTIVNPILHVIVRTRVLKYFLSGCSLRNGKAEILIHPSHLLLTP